MNEHEFYRYIQSHDPSQCIHCLNTKSNSFLIHCARFLWDGTSWRGISPPFSMEGIIGSMEEEATQYQYRDSIPPIRCRPIIRLEQNEHNLINLLDLHPVMQPQTKIKCKMILTYPNHVTTLDRLPSWKGRFLENPKQKSSGQLQVWHTRSQIKCVVWNVVFVALLNYLDIFTGDGQQ